MTRIMDTGEVITMHIDLATRRSSAFPAAIQASVEALKTAHAQLPRPDRIGRTIAIRRRPV